MISTTDKKIMLKTARSCGAVGKNAVLPRFISEVSDLKSHLILDFGCGKNAIHVKKLREQGFEFVFGVDLEPLANPEYEFQHISSVPWHIVYASNVLNVQPTRSVLEETLSQIAHYARHGVAYMSYPKSPRKLGVGVADMLSLIEPFFSATYNFNYRKVTIYKAVGKFCQKGLEKRLTV